jgi:uncharacterized protein
MKFAFISFEHFNQLCTQLALSLRENEERIDYIVSIQRGGAVMSKIISDLLNIPIATITASSYIDGQKVETPSIIQDISIDVAGKNLVVVDEISDTGATLKVVDDYLKARKAASVKTATLFVKTGTTFTPDYWLETLDKWIVFPYELKETADTLRKIPDLSQDDFDAFLSYVRESGLDRSLVHEFSLDISTEQS